MPPPPYGLLTLPLMLGIIVCSAISGRVMGRTGRYKIFPVIGTGLMFVSMLMFSTLKADTPLWHALAFMVVLGAGLGLSMQMLVISVQNALPPRDMGVATSSVTFFRSMGGTFGAAVSLAVLFSTVAGNIKARAIAAALPQSVIDQFGHASALNDTSVIATLPEPVRRVILEGFADSMHTVFITVAVLLVPAFLLAIRIPEVPLRSAGGLAAQQTEAGEPAAGEAAKTDSAVV